MSPAQHLATKTLRQRDRFVMTSGISVGRFRLWRMNGHSQLKTLAAVPCHGACWSQVATLTLVRLRVRQADWLRKEFPLVNTKSKLEISAADDIALVHAAKEGDTAAFGELVNRYTQAAFRVAMHILNSREDAEDVVQEAFLSAFQHIDRFEERARFSTWLTRITVNAALVKLRSARRAVLVSTSQEAEDGTTLEDKIADWKPNAEQLYSRAELRKILARVIASLPHSYRVVFLFRDVEGLSTAETAEMLGLTVANVKSRLVRARLFLRDRLSRYFEQDREVPLPLLFGEQVGSDISQLLSTRNHSMPTF